MEDDTELVTGNPTGRKSSSCGSG